MPSLRAAVAVAVAAAAPRALGGDVVDWSCADADPKWHFRREAVRYVMYEEAAPLRTSMDSLRGLVSLWQSDASTDPGSECPVGRGFFMMLDAIMGATTQSHKMHTIDVLPFSAVLSFLDVAVPAAGALRSGWPLFGLLAVAQREFLRLADDGGPSPLPALTALTTGCAEGAPLAAELRAWMAASAAPGPPASLLRAHVEAERLRGQVMRNAACAQDPSARAAAELVRVLRTRGANSTRALIAGALDAPLDSAFEQAGFLRVFFSSWPVLAVLHRMQEAQIRDADCHDAEPGAYALQTRAVPDSFWVCVRRKQDLVDERWRMQGVFGDCFYIVQAMHRESSSGCLFLDIGANFGACALPLAKRGIEVMAFEPLAVVARLLRGAAARNGLAGAVAVHTVAVGRGGAGALSCEQGHSATCQFVRGAPGAPRAGVQSITMDEALRAFGASRRVCGVKIDVEGAEEEVLAGGSATLSSLRPPLFLELHLPELEARGTSVERVFDMLVGYGYDSFIPLSDETPPSCHEHGLRGSGTFPDMRWGVAEALRAFSSVPDACTCSLACFEHIFASGCRCWDFSNATQLCTLYRRCRSRDAAPGWHAGALNGVWRVSATSASAA